MCCVYNIENSKRSQIVVCYTRNFNMKLLQIDTYKYIHNRPLNFLTNTVYL